MSESPKSKPSRVRSDFFHNSTGVLAQADPERIFGDDWESTAYVPPSIHRAKADATQKKYLQGHASFCNVDLKSTGAGVSLYFKLLERGILFFFVATIAILPSLYIMFVTMQTKSKALSGQQLLDDPLKLSQLSLGSLDGNTSIPLPWTNANGIHEILEPPMIGIIITFIDFFIILLFVLVIYIYGKDIEKCTNEADDGDNDRNVSVTDFAVYVTGLPATVHTKDVHEFFSNQYSLKSWPSGRDWSFIGYCGCLKLMSKKARLITDYEDRGVVMTEDSDNDSEDEDDDDDETNEKEEEDKYEIPPVLITTNPIYQAVDSLSNHNPSAATINKARESWVAETTLVRSDGDMIRHFMSMKALVQKSMKQRATIKQHRANAALGDSNVHIIKRSKSNAKIKKARYSLEKSKKKLINIDLRKEKKVNQFNDKQNILDARPVVGAFVVFNNEQSRSRCLIDYTGSDHWFWNYVQVPPLQYVEKDENGNEKRYKLTVTAATAPTDVVWENMEEKCGALCCRRTLTMIASLILIIGAAVLARQYIQFKSILFPSTLPTYKECHSSANSNATTAWLNECTMYANDDNAATNVTTTMCTQCYCMELTVDALIGSDLISGVSSVLDKPECVDFAFIYGSGQAIAIIAAFVVVAVNMILRVLLRCMSNFERYKSLTRQQAQLAFKLFVVQTLNTAIIVVLVNAKVITENMMDDVTSDLNSTSPGSPGSPGSPADNGNQNTGTPGWLLPFHTLGFLNGALPDITPAWYATVGTPILFTVLINIAGPHAVPLLKALVIQPLQRKCGDCCCGTPHRQEDLNRRYVGKAFDVTARYAQLMTNLCIVLLYFGGLPLLLPVGLVAFSLTYIIDKLLLLRFYAQPPQYDAKLAILTYNLMPLFVLGHLLLTSWMFGSQDILYSQGAMSNDGALGRFVKSNARKTSRHIKRRSTRDVVFTDFLNTEIGPATRVLKDVPRGQGSLPTQGYKPESEYKSIHGLPPTWFPLNDTTANNEDEPEESILGGLGFDDSIEFNLAPLSLGFTAFFSHASYRLSRTTALTHFLAFVLLLLYLLISAFFSKIFHCIRGCCCKITPKGKSNHYPPWTSEYLQPIDPYNSYKNSVLNGEESTLTEEDKDLGWTVDTYLATCTKPLISRTSVSDHKLMVGKKQYLCKKWTRQEIEDKDQVGTKKLTWEVAAENSIHTYRIDDNPRYSDIVTEMRASMRRKEREAESDAEEEDDDLISLPSEKLTEEEEEELAEREKYGEVKKHITDQVEI